LHTPTVTKFRSKSTVKKSGKRGCQVIFTDVGIEAVLVGRATYFYQYK